MSGLNYHHLLYFWTVAKEGSIAAASERLSLASSTISVQIRELEDHLQEKLFERQGRRLVLTEAGHLTLAYADDIFSLGRELVETIKSGHSARPQRLRIGISADISRFIASKLFQPLVSPDSNLHLIFTHAPQAALLYGLSTQELDLVLTDQALNLAASTKIYAHPLGSSSISVFGSAKRRASQSNSQKLFPQQLQGAPFFMPSNQITLRRMFNAWLQQQELTVQEIAEFDERGLMESFSAHTDALLPACSVLAPELEPLGLYPLGELQGLQESFFVLTAQKTPDSPELLHLQKHARSFLEPI